MTNPIQQAIEALEEAQNGLAWYRDRNPDQSDGSDDEAALRIEHAIHNLRAVQEVWLPPLPEPGLPGDEGACCGNYVTGAEYMGERETLCCGCPDGAYPDGFTADQMREYARTAIAAAGGGVPQGLAAILEDCRNALMECDRDGDYPLIDRIDAALASSPQPEAAQSDVNELRRALCQIGVVGQIDGFDVIRRESVIDIVDRRIAATEAIEKFCRYPDCHCPTENPCLQGLTIKTPAQPEAAPAVAQVPVAWIYWHPRDDTFDGPDTTHKTAVARFSDDTRIAMQRDGWKFEPLYAAPEAPAQASNPTQADIDGARKLMRMTEAEIDEELRKLGIDPEIAASAPVFHLRSYGDVSGKYLEKAAAPAQAVKVEPVAWMYRVFSTVHFHEKRLDHYYNDGKDYIKGEPLYASPPSREPLTDEQIERLQTTDTFNGMHPDYLRECVREVERALGIHPREGGSNGE